MYLLTYFALKINLLIFRYALMSESFGRLTCSESLQQNK